MPKVTISSSKGLEQTSGSGFSVSDVELVRSSESITPTGGVYTVTCIKEDTHTGGSLLSKSFTIYDQNGASYGIWFDVGATDPAVPVAIDATDSQIEVDISAAALASAVATALAAAIETASSEHECVVDGDDVLIYVLDSGAMTTDTEDDGDSEFTVSLVDGSSGDLDEDVETSLITIGNDEATVVLQSVALANGSTAGQRKNVMFAVSSTSATMIVGGNLWGGGSAKTLLTSTATKAGVACLVWSGSTDIGWIVVNSVNVTAS